MRRPRWNAAILVLFLALLSCPGLALAHKPSDSYLTLTIPATEDSVVGRWDIALRDLDYAIGLDADGDGKITWGEVKAKTDEISSYALARLAISARGVDCPETFKELLIDNHSDGAYAVLRFSADCPRAGEGVRVSYSLFFDLDPQHRGLLNLITAEGTQTAVLGPEAPQRVFTFSGSSLEQQFTDYFVTGVEHIWNGYDHLLFLISLLLPAVLSWVSNRWIPIASLRVAFFEVLKVVTAFTVAHSITLTLATLGIVRAPSRISESAIALSVVIAAFNNLYPLFGRRQWLVAFCFGLIHGFGFANVLSDLGLPRTVLTLALVGFNLGVEAGQLTIVGIFLPYAYLIRDTVAYRRLVLTGGSSAIILVAAIWFAERAFEIRIITNR